MWNRSAQAPTVPCTSRMSRRIKCATYVLFASICSLSSFAVAESPQEQQIIQASQLDTAHISINLSPLSTAHDRYQIRIPLQDKTVDLETVTWSVSAVNELPGAIAMIRDRSLKSVQVQMSWIDEKFSILPNECRVEGLSLKACREALKDHKSLTFEKVPCTKVCPIATLNY